MLKIFKKENGFTLIEVFAAVIILGLAYVVILQSFSISLRNIEHLDRTATRLLEDVLEFETMLQPSENKEPEAAGDVYLEGAKYRLILIANEKRDLMTLKLEQVEGIM